MWKQRKEVTIYKCCNDNCEYRRRRMSKLNEREKELVKTRGSQFKLTYQYREYHFALHDLTHCAPEHEFLNLTKIHNGPNVLGPILAFYVSFALSARKTAYVLRSVFGISLSHQTVLNYASAAAFYCHNFNTKHKGPVDLISAGDEAYIKIMGKQRYVFFFISSENLKITAYHLAKEQGDAACNYCYERGDPYGRAGTVNNSCHRRQSFLSCGDTLPERAERQGLRCLPTRR